MKPSNLLLGLGLKTGPSRRDDRSDWMWPSRTLEAQETIYCPWRDGHLFLHHFPALRTGLLSNVPAGLIFSATVEWCDLVATDTHGLSPDYAEPPLRLARNVRQTPGRAKRSTGSMG